MEKSILILLLILCSCTVKEKSIACSKFETDREIDINIKADYDKIKYVEVIQTYTLDNFLLLNEERLDVLKKQLDDTYYFVDNKLIKKEIIGINDNYSLDETIRYLRKDRYNCE